MSKFFSFLPEIFCEAVLVKKDISEAAAWLASLERFPAASKGPRSSALARPSACTLAIAEGFY